MYRDQQPTVVKSETQHRATGFLDRLKSFNFFQALNMQ